ncbi:zinc finger protein 311-like [Polyodon spathula]|uniref:zinc finger protein 311-like n=1 Tax=Polyodon spathula TaxID=7913 RepID=UPI001B7F790F|nr:zinc finger protein 311-like [Polyodon spathula]
MQAVCETKEMDICSSSASLLQEELASAIEPAVKAAVLSVMSALAKFVDSKCAVFHLRLDERDHEFESVRLRLEIAESELKAIREGECMNAADQIFAHPLTNTKTQNSGSDSIIAHGLPAPPARVCSTAPVQPVRDPVPAVHTAPKNSRVIICPELLVQGGDCEQMGHASGAAWRTVEGPAERDALPHAEEGSKAESAPIQEELFDQEWCRSPKQATELTSIEGKEEEAGLDPVHIKEEIPELDPVCINEEIPGIESVIIKDEVLELESDPVEEGGSDRFERRQQIQTGQKPYRCPDCGKRFSTSTELKRHHRIHTGEKPYHCNACGMSFSTSGDLKRHQRIHTGEKPYRCTECGKSFTQLGTLTLHLRIHTGEKPYGCTACGKSFKQLQHLKKHLQIHMRERL